MGTIKIIKPCFRGDFYQVVRVYGFHSSLISWASTLQEAREIAARYM